MLARQRQALILARIREDGGVRVADLARDLGVSDMTVRRDLEILDRRGLIEKVHGGATSLPSSALFEPGFEAKSELQEPEKESIADAAVAPRRARDRDRHLRRHDDLRPGPPPRRRPRLTVVTNSVPVADVLHRAGRSDQTIILTGGVRTPSDALVGPFAVAALRTIHLDQVFMGVHGMDPRSGFTTPERPRGRHRPGPRRRRPPARRLRRLEQVGRHRDQLDRPARRGRHARDRRRPARPRPARSPADAVRELLIAPDALHPVRPVPPRRTHPDRARRSRAGRDGPLTADGTTPPSAGRATAASVEPSRAPASPLQPAPRRVGPRLGRPEPATVARPAEGAAHEQRPGLRPDVLSLPGEPRVERGGQSGLRRDVRVHERLRGAPPRRPAGRAGRGPPPRGDRARDVPRHLLRPPPRPDAGGDGRPRRSAA